ncbi:hypothetical protein PCE1_000450 [Barthelona sp. PCE]
MKFLLLLSVIILVTASKKAVVTDKVYMDIGVGDEVYRVKLGLFGEIVPKTVSNFRALITGEFVEENELLTYKNSIFHRIIPGFVLQVGDLHTRVVDGVLDSKRPLGTGGASIFGDRFDDENFSIKHKRKGLLSMANSGPGTNGSQVFLTLAPFPHLDNKHVVFGTVLDKKSMEIVEMLSKVETDSKDQPIEHVVVVGCGLLE